MNRGRLWNMMDRQKASYRRSMKPVFIKAFDQQIQPLWDKIKQSSDIRDIEVPPLNNKPIEEAYTKLYLATTIDFARAKRKWLQRRLLKSEDEIFEDLIMQKIKTYLRQNAGATVTAAGDTSVELIRQLLKKITPEILDMGIGAGASQTMLRDRIGSAWHEMEYFRTERIVRTEVNRAANFGNLEGTISLGVPMQKIWLSAFSQHSRKEHMAADAQAVDLEMTFNVGGESLKYPGDPVGSPANTINCLCNFYEKLK